MSIMSDEQIEPIESTVEEVSEPVLNSTGDNDEELRNFGAGIAICAILVLFVGSTFAIWNLEVTMESDFTDIKLEYAFDIEGIELEIDSDGESDDDSVKYDDSDCDCSDTESFFGNLKILLYLVLASGAFLAYMGHTGEKMEFSTKVIALVAVLSIIIALYTFVSLPSAWQEDMEMENVDLKFMGSDDHSEDGVESEVKGSPGMGYLVALVPLGLSGYLIKTRGITLEDITG